MRAINDIEVPEGLESKIVGRIKKEETKLARKRLVFFGLISGTSLILALPTAKMIGESFAYSGFFRYFSLIFSDGGAVFSFISDFGSLLAESFPVLESAIFLSVVFAIFWSLGETIKNIKEAFPRFKANHA